jgi:hypothetical protein
MVLVLDAVSSSTSTANAEYEYEYDLRPKDVGKTKRQGITADCQVDP